MSVVATADVLAAQHGDRQAFCRLIDATRNLVCTIALSATRDVDASEDVAQQVYVAAWRDLPALREPESFLPWLKQLTRHRSLNAIRSEKRIKTRERNANDVHAIPNAAEQLVRQEEERILGACIEELPDVERELVVLFYREGTHLAQVAQLLEISESAVKKRIERARKHLREGVESRFAEVARSTAPTAAFTVVVAAALDTVAPTTAVAAALKGGATATFFTPIIGLLGGLGGVLLAYVIHSGAARSDKARTDLKRLTMLSGAMLTTWFAAFCYLAPESKNRLLLVMPYVALVSAHAVLYVVWLPRLLRLDDQVVRRRYRIFLGFFVGGAATGIATLLWIVYRLK